jgi:radical SAM superfamily enzyme YgiQ (UPF0313 family)
MRYPVDRSPPPASEFDTMSTQSIDEYSFEVGPIRPPSEGGSHSLLLRPTRNCSWGRCKFCYGLVYDRQKLEIRSVEEIEKDIDSAKAIADGIRAVSWQMGNAGAVNHAVGAAMVRANPRLNSNHCFALVFNWLAAGARTVFLQDANTPIMRTRDLLEVLRYLGQQFPTLERVTSYARSKTIAKKSLEELKELRFAGLSRLHVGLESGDDDVLRYVDKGVTAEEQIAGGKKAKQAGFELSEYVMPDLGGRSMSDQHARNTARVLNEIDPDFIRMRPFVVGQTTPLYDDYQSGALQLSSPHERLRELRTLIQNLNVTSRVCFDHFLNAWYQEPSRHRTLFTQDYNGYKFPEEKEAVLELIEEGLRLDESLHMHVKDMVELRSL